VWVVQLKIFCITSYSLYNKYQRNTLPNRGVMRVSPKLRKTLARTWDITETVLAPVTLALAFLSVELHWPWQAILLLVVSAIALTTDILRSLNHKGIKARRMPAAIPGFFAAIYGVKYHSAWLLYIGVTLSSAVLFYFALAVAVNRQRQRTEPKETETEKTVYPY
jgi:hypothetical protein